MPRLPILITSDLSRRMISPFSTYQRPILIRVAFLLAPLLKRVVVRFIHRVVVVVVFLSVSDLASILRYVTI